MEGGGRRRVEGEGPVAVFTYEMLYLGTAPPIDPVEGAGNFTSENAATLVGQTFGSPADPLFERQVLVDFDDADNNGFVAEDAGGAETLTYDIGSGPVTVPLDSTVAYSVTITYGPASGLPPVTVTAGVLQDEAGNMFLLGPATLSSSTTALGAAPIRSITINAVARSNYSGVQVPRFAVDFLCFGTGTRIATPGGEVAVERLQAGDAVLTRDRRPQRLRLRAHRRVRATGNLAPVVFAPGAIGNRRRLVLSPQHRLLVSGAAAELFFGEAEVLVPAVALVNGADIVRQEGGTIDYHHLVFDRHEIVYAEGVAAESLLVGGGSLARMPAALRREVLAIFPEAARWGAATGQPLARPCVTRREGALLAGALFPGRG